MWEVFVRHVSSLSRQLTEAFHSAGEVKTLMIQLLRGVRHLHDNWILHRDLKTSNLLLSHKGILKVSQLSERQCARAASVSERKH